MSIIRIGTTKKYADGWEAIFGHKSKKEGSEKQGTVRARKPIGKTRKKKTPARKKR